MELGVSLQAVNEDVPVRHCATGHAMFMLFYIRCSSSSAPCHVRIRDFEL